MQRGWVRLLLLWFLASPTLLAQPEGPKLKFQRYTLEDGLPTSPVMDIVQDKHGFLWISTWTGLFQFDGYTFHEYWHDPTDSLSVSHDWVGLTYVDREGTYWVGTNGGGLNRFDPARGAFSRFKHDPADPTSLSSNEVTKIFEDREGVLWIGTGRGLNRFDRRAEQFERFMYAPDNPAGLLGDQIRDVHEDAQGVLWIATGNPFVPGRPGALNRYNRADDTFTPYQVNAGDCLDSCLHVLDIYTDDTGRFWISTWGAGMYEFDRDTGTFSSLDILERAPRDRNRDRVLGVNTIVQEPSTGAIWLGAYGSGLYRYDPATGSTANYTPDPNNPYSLSDGRIWEILFDREGNLWVGTHSGLHKTNPVGTIPRYGLGAPAALDDEWVTNILEDEEGTLWIGTSAMRVLGWDRFSDQWTAHEPPESPCLQWRVPGASLSASRQKHLWVATSCGLYAFDRVTGAFSPYPYDLRPLEALYASDALDIVEEASGHIWLSSTPGALRLDPSDGTFSRYLPDPDDPASLSFDETTTVSADRSGTIWVGTTRGVNRFDPETGTFTQFLTHLGEQDVSVTHIRAEEDGALWLATDVMGLVRLDPQTGAHTSYTVRDGLHTNTLIDFVRDDAGYFWLFSNRAVSAFHPVTGAGKTFEYGADGFLPMHSFRHAALASSDGTLVVGGQGGLNVFDPAPYRPRLTPPGVVLTGLQVSGERLEPGPGRLLSEPLSETEHVTLTHTQNDLTFEFVGLTFRDPKLTRYRYRLENYDADWVEARAQRSARYTNLAPGDYTFHVTAASGTGVWPEGGATLSITITPPWWRTVWAYGLFAVLIGGVLYGARRYEMNRIRLKHSAQLEHAEAESLRSLDRAKSQFFTNISHEFRTPLTLILGPVTDAIERRQGLPLGQLPIVRRNGERLLRLVNQLLDLARLEAGGMTLRTDRSDLVPFLKGVLYSFESQAEQDEIALQFESDRQHLVLPFERDKLEQVFYNLIGNAFKYTPAGGRISVVCTVREDAFAEIMVRDTGSGIQPDHLPYVFDRFFQSSSDERRAEQGSGIGLALTKALVELHGGTIAVQSEVEVGTAFTIRLPLGPAPPSGDGAADVVPEEELPPLHNGHTVPWSVEEPAFSRDADEGPEEQAGASTADEPSPSDDEQAVVLIVEDNADVRAYVRHHLESAYTVLEAPDGAEGVARAREAIPDLIVTDVMMPEVDGYGLAHAVRSDERTSHIPIVMLTAKASEDDKLEGLDTGVDDYLLKPFSPRELRARVRNLIAQRRLLRERFKTATVIRPAEVTAVSLDQEFLTRTVAVIEGHLEEGAFAVPDLAEEVGLSVSQLNRKLNALVGQSAGQLVRSMRLQRGADLLAQEAGTVAEIAYRVGFNSQAHFSTSFKKQFGVTPSDYQRRAADAADAGRFA